MLGSSVIFALAAEPVATAKQLGCWMGDDSNEDRACSDYCYWQQVPDAIVDDGAAESSAEPENPLANEHL